MVSEQELRQTKNERVNSQMENGHVNSSTSSLVSASQKNGMISFSHHFSVKLGDDNFLLWEQQITATINGHKLQKYLTQEKPPRFANDSDKAAGKINEQFIEWEQQDQLLLSWLLASMNETMLARVVGCRSAKQVWARIQNHFACHTKAKIRQLKLQLRNTKKGTLKMSEYLLKIKATIDALIAVGYDAT